MLTSRFPMQIRVTMTSIVPYALDGWTLKAASQQIQQTESSKVTNFITKISRISKIVEDNAQIMTTPNHTIIKHPSPLPGKGEMVLFRSQQQRKPRGL
jgi:predicted GTPase